MNNIGDALPQEGTAQSPIPGDQVHPSAGASTEASPQEGTAQSPLPVDQVRLSAGASTESPPQTDPKAMFESLQESMRTSAGPGRLEVWRQTIQELFKVEYSRLPVRSESLPQERKRFPKLKGPEQNS